MPTWVHADQELIESVKRAGGKIVRVGFKPWAYFYGDDAEERGKAVVQDFLEMYECQPKFAGRRWRDDQNFDYAIRLDL